MKKRIVCFGDSNTWGYNAATQERFDDDERWTGVMSAALGEGYTVIEEGLSGRTTVWDDPIERHKNGFTYMLPMLESHKPFDLIIIMLGTNDLKRRFSLSARDIAQSAALLAKTAMRSECGRNGGAPKAMLVSPIHVGDCVQDSWLAEMFTSDAKERSQRFDHWYKSFANEINAIYLNAANYAEPDPADGLHIPLSGHKALGIALAELVLDVT